MPTRVLHVSDLHLSSSHDHEGVDPDRSLGSVLDACAHLDGLAAVLATGDIADDGSAEAYRRAHAALSAFAGDRGAHLFMTTGNHDDRSRFTEVLGHGHFAPDGSSSGRAGPRGRICASTTSAELRIVTLDSLVPGRWFGRLGTEQLAWLRSILDAEPDLPTVIGFHHPPITLDVEIQRRVCLEDRDELASTLRHGNPVAVLCGHFHQQVSGQLAGVPTWVTPGVYTQIDHLSRPAGTERATAGGSATLVELTEPSSPTFAVVAADDPARGREVYRTTLSELRDDLRRYGLPTTPYARGVTKSIGLLGDDRGHRSHRELNALVPRLAAEYGVQAVWLPTDSSFDVTSFDGIWLVPGSPYADDDAVIDALHTVRANRIPFLGTCSGMQYAVMEFLRHELGQAATHAESDGEGEDNAVVQLACSLYGEGSEVRPVPGSRFAGWVPEPFVGMHFCNYAPSPASVAALQGAGVVVGATGAEAGAEVLEFPDHPFFVASMFQPHIGALAGQPTHPLVAAFMTAVIGRTGVAEGHVQAIPSQSTV